MIASAADAEGGGGGGTGMRGRLSVEGFSESLEHGFSFSKQSSHSQQKPRHHLQGVLSRTQYGMQNLLQLIRKQQKNTIIARSTYESGVAWLSTPSDMAVLCSNRLCLL